MLSKGIAVFKSENAEAFFNRGVRLMEEGDYAKAEKCFLRTRVLAPDSLETLLNLGYVLDMLGRSEEGLDCYEKVLASSPDNAKARYNRAAHRLRSGNLSQGFSDYEARFFAMKQVDTRVYAQPRWDGSPLNGRSILVYCEQGLGDAIQFCRYIPLLAKHGGKVVLEVQQPLLSLLSLLDGVEKVIPRASIPPTTDLYIPLLTLPLIFKTTLETIPRDVPYIAPSSDAVEQWRTRLHCDRKKLCIGLAWAGKVHPYPNRSCPPENLLPLRDLPGVSFYSLQIDASGSVKTPVEFSEQLIDATKDIHDFNDTAALITNLDLVITIDTALAHLAGALGKTVWVMLPAVSDWRWLENRNDSPWYPTMRLFRQPCPGDWSSVVQEIKTLLYQKLSNDTLTAISPDDAPETIFDRALTCIENNSLDAAVTLIESLLRKNPDEPAAWFNLGRAYEMKEQLTEARNCFQQALILQPDSPSIWHALGKIHLKKKLFSAAEACLRKAHDYLPESVEILFDLGDALLQLDKSMKAFECCDKILAIDPDNKMAVFNKAYLQLRSGDLGAGFANFEVRLDIEKFNIDPRRYSQPRWDGRPLNGQTILIYGEQGIGDVIQLSRYVPMVAERGGKIVLELDPPLIPLFRSFPGVFQIVQKANTPPLADWYIQSLSLPYVFGTTLETVPNKIPYIIPEAGKVAEWHKLLADVQDYRIGLVWRGNPKNPVDTKRSCPLSAFLPLATLPGVQFFSLQIGAGTEDISAHSDAIEIIDHTGKLSDFSDTAAFIANLDLVIGVDTAVTHLAGAMGKPVWVILPHVYDWRWIIGRNDTPWYPTCRVFWQERNDDWEGAVQRVVEALEIVLGERSIGVDFGDLEAYYSLGASFKEAGDLAGAEQCFRKIIEHRPELPDPQHSLGVVLHLQGRHQEAIGHYRLAIGADPAFVQAHYNLANALLLCGMHYEAIQSVRTALHYNQDHANSHWLLGMLLLQRGDFLNGWKEYEWRWRATEFKSRLPDLGCPQWDGAPLNNRTLLVHMEQGRGDMIQFVRYVPMIAAMGGKVIVSAANELVSLLETVNGVSMVVGQNGSRPACDFHIPALSLPSVLGTTLESIPAQTPYLRPDPAKVEAWRNILPADGELRIGLAWQGSAAHRDDRNRSCPLAAFEALAGLEGIALYSLQIGAGTEQLLGLPDSMVITDYTGQIHDFSDTAAFIENLDLVISVDTAIAHLAGALGKTVWTLLPFASEWRWLLEREDSPWYPTMRLFRQSSPGDWPEVMARVRQLFGGLAVNADQHIQSGIAQLKSGRAVAAEHDFSLAISLKPDSAEAHCSMGIAMDAQGRHEEAIACYRTALLYKPDYLQALFNMGNSFISLGKQTEARACYERVVELQPDFVPAYLCLGEIGKKRRNFDLAHHSYERVLTINESSSEALQGLAETYQAEEKFEQAIKAYQQVLSLEPDRSTAWNMLGTVYHIIGNSTEAESCYRKALQLSPASKTILNNLGVALNAQGRHEDAIDTYRQLLDIDSNYADGHWNLSTALLALGQYSEGWREYEWRFKKTDPVPDRHFTQPCWDGSPLCGKTILLHAEQGFGDTLQFIRYVPLVAALGGTVVVECQVPVLKRLLRSITGVGRIIATGEPLPDFDCHLPLLSLPLLFETTLETIPSQVPYLLAEPGDVETWLKRMKPPAGALRVGLVWHGRQGQILNRKRSCPLETLSCLADIPGIEFYSLQIGDGTDQLKSCAAGFPIIDLTEHIRDFADTAAFMANLDLVITIDTAVAHLAGAVGARTWLLLPFGADWRWLRERKDSPWYPSMRLFRQPSMGEWPSVITSVAGALIDEMERGNMCGKKMAVTQNKLLPSRPAKQNSFITETGRPGNLLVGIAWSCRQDNPLTLNRICPFSALAPLFALPGFTFFNLQPGAQLEEGAATALADLTQHIRDFEDTAALMANLDLVISIDTSVVHLAAATGRPTWLLLPYVADWRWLMHREDSPWYPGMRLFRQPDFNDWDSVVRTVAYELSLLTGNISRLPPVPASYATNTRRLELEHTLEGHLQALSKNPYCTDTLLDVGAAQALLGSFYEAETTFRKAIETDPASVTGHLNLAYALLAQGKYGDGFAHHEWRLKKIPPGQIPPWPLLQREELGTHRRGTSLLVHCEQGFGDTIQFSRFPPLLTDAGYQVVVSCHPSLVSIIKSVNNHCRVVAYGEPLPVCDLQTLLLSLPGIFGVTPETLPSRIPYLYASSRLISEWRGRLSVFL